MLLRINIKNYRSFYENSSFDMFPNLKRTTFSNHIYSNHKIPLLKQAVIYGGNGSGKSNFLNAFSFIKKFVTEKDFLTEDLINENKFRLLKEENKEAIEFLIEFKNGENYYIYKISLNQDDIKEELKLSGVGEKNDVLLFKRRGVNLETKKEISIEIVNATKELLKKNKYSSILALNNEFPILNDEHIKNAFNWFDDNLKTLSLNRFFPSLIELMSKNEKILNFANNIFKEIGLGVESLKIASENIDKYLEDEDITLLNEKLEENKVIARFENDKLLFTIVKEKEKQIIKKILFEQIGVDSYCTDMEIKDQSDGTVKILNLIPALYDVIENEKVICIDEIENSIHPALIFEIISFFANSKSKGQLIFSTHETELLNQQKLMRTDEIWFAEKNKGNTQIYSLNDFKQHNTINIKNGYLEGRYGGIPFIGKLS